ncbi:MAG: DivIVA domain-containing protein [Gaiella sp.]
MDTADTERDPDALLADTSPDWVLEQLARVAADGVPIPVTLLVGGVVISGDLSSVEELGRAADRAVADAVWARDSDDEPRRDLSTENGHDLRAPLLRDTRVAASLGSGLPVDLSISVLTLCHATAFGRNLKGPVPAGTVSIRVRDVEAWWLGRTDSRELTHTENAIDATLLPGALDPTEIEAFRPRRLLGGKQVREFLHEMATSYRGVLRERADLEGEVKVLQEEVTSQRAAIGEALLAASTAAQSVRQEASEEAERLLADTRAIADRMIRNAELERDRIELEIAELRSFAAQMRAETAGTLAGLLDRLEAMTLPDENPARRLEPVLEPPIPIR